MARPGYDDSVASGDQTDADSLDELMRRPRHMDCDCMECLPWTY